MLPEGKDGTCFSTSVPIKRLTHRIPNAQLPLCCDAIQSLGQYLSSLTTAIGSC